MGNWTQHPDTYAVEIGMAVLRVFKGYNGAVDRGYLAAGKLVDVGALER